MELCGIQIHNLYFFFFLVIFFLNLHLCYLRSIVFLSVKKASVSVSKQYVQLFYFMQKLDKTPSVFGSRHIRPYHVILFTDFEFIRFIKNTKFVYVRFKH